MLRSQEVGFSFVGLLYFLNYEKSSFDLLKYMKEGCVRASVPKKKALCSRW